MGAFQERVVWVTGAGSGIGRAVACMFAGEGASVALIGRSVDKLERVKAEIRAIGGRGDIVALDVCRREQVKAAAAGLLERCHRVDVLVNNAGLNIRGRKLGVLTGEDWDRMVETNLTGAFNMINAVLPAMRQQQDGLIVNVSSIAARRIYRGAGAAYTASKHGMNGLSLAVSAEEESNGIRCTALMPGLVNTDHLDKQAATFGAEERALMIQPDDIAQVIRFLALLPSRCKVPEMQLVPTRPQPARRAGGAAS